jgi:hypothetical protein
MNEPEANDTELVDLAARLAYVDSDTLNYIRAIGKLVRVSSRMGHAWLGVLTGIRCKVEQLELAIESVERDYNEGVKYREVKTVIVPVSNLLAIDLLHERQAVDDDSSEQDNVDDAIASLLQ